MTRTVPALLVMLSCATAQAQLSLEWEAPIECPTRDSVHEEVARLLGGTLPEPLDLSARGVTTRSEGEWTLTLRTLMDGVEGERVIEADGCEELGAAASLILALMIDPSAVARAQPEPGPEPGPGAGAGAGAGAGTGAGPGPGAGPGAGAGPDAEATPIRASIARDLTPPARDGPPARPRVSTAASARAPSARPSSDEEPRETPPEDPDALGGFIGVGGLLDIGSVPDVSGGVVLEGGFGVALIDVRLRATFVIQRTALRRDMVSGAEITAGSVDARACVHPFEDARFVHGCVGFILGVAVAQGIGLDRNDLGVGTYAGAVAGLGLAWRPEPWFDLELDVSLIVPFNPLEFAVRSAPDDVFHTMEPVAGRFGLAAHVRF